MISIPNTIAETMANHARTWYPGECCGVLISVAGSEDVIDAVCMDNLQDKYHELDPEDFPRTSRDAFKINERAYARLSEDLAEEKKRILAIFHSHIDCGAYFSEEDILMAAPFGTPNEPDIWHVVMDGQNNGVHGAKAYKWDGTSFIEHILTDFPEFLS